MAPTRKSQHAKTKVFQCKGYGDCRMVFTRSEHLARHTRKHTGEKPFKCVVPGCERMFSRFDNMMQHTQTHRSSERKGNPSTAEQTTPTRSELTVETTPASPDRHAHHGGLLSPVSMGSSADWDETDTVATKSDFCTSEPASPVLGHSRRLSVADLCNPVRETIHLTPDEFEALEGFARFRKTPLFYESLNDLRSVACIQEGRYLHRRPCV